jgi:hypothetical protein
MTLAHSRLPVEEAKLPALSPLYLRVLVVLRVLASSLTICLLLLGHMLDVRRTPSTMGPSVTWAVVGTLLEIAGIILIAKCWRVRPAFLLAATTLSLFVLCCRLFDPQLPIWPAAFDVAWIAGASFVLGRWGLGWFRQQRFLTKAIYPPILSQDPFEVLALRLARGEMTLQEYEAALKYPYPPILSTDPLVVISLRLARGELTAAEHKDLHDALSKARRDRSGNTD